LSQTLSDRSLSVVIDGHLGAVQTRDKSWLVQVGPNTQILSYASTGGPVGAALNLPGNNGADPLGMSVPAGQPVFAGDALILVAGALPGAPSSVSEAMAVVFVPYAVAEGMLRPPCQGNHWYVRNVMRAEPLYEGQCLMSRCPPIVDLDQLYQPIGPINPAAWGSAPPTIDGLLADMGRMSGDYGSGWNVAGFAPHTQHRGYGTFYAGQVSTALLMALSTKDEGQRKAMMLALVQRGIDEIGAVVDGKVGYPSGGHCQGRKALVIFAGHMLGVDLYAKPSNIFPNVFQEDLGYPMVNWWAGGWTVGWAFSTNPSFNGSMLAQSPDTWGARFPPLHDTWNWMFAYYGQVLPCQVGTALAMHLIGREAEMGNLNAAVHQFMKGPTREVADALTAAGHAIAWGSDYAVPTGFCAEAYRQFGPPL
jgi:hypothetical protein